jgi:hypothetical protein
MINIYKNLCKNNSKFQTLKSVILNNNNYMMSTKNKSNLNSLIKFLQQYKVHLK